MANLHSAVLAVRKTQTHMHKGVRVRQTMHSVDLCSTSAQSAHLTSEICLVSCASTHGGGEQAQDGVVHAHCKFHDRPVLLADLRLTNIQEFSRAKSIICGLLGASEATAEGRPARQMHAGEVTLSLTGPISHCKPKMTVKYTTCLGMHGMALSASNGNRGC